jgi:hypothetical protein
MRMYFADPLGSGTDISAPLPDEMEAFPPSAAIDLGALATITWMESEAVAVLALGSSRVAAYSPSFR